MWSNNSRPSALLWARRRSRRHWPALGCISGPRRWGAFSKRSLCRHQNSRKRLDSSGSRGHFQISEPPVECGPHGRSDGCRFLVLLAPLHVFRSDGRFAGGWPSPWITTPVARWALRSSRRNRTPSKCDPFSAGQYASLAKRRSILSATREASSGVTVSRPGVDAATSNLASARSASTAASPW